MKISPIAISLLVLITCNNCSNIKKDSNLTFTNRVVLIDLNESNVSGFALDTLFKKISDQFNNKLCFIDPKTGKIQIAASKDSVDKSVYFNDILAIRVMGKNKYVDMLDEVKRKIVFKFRQPNRNTLMVDATLHKFETGRAEETSGFGSHEVDIKHPERFLMSDIEFVLKLGVRDPVSD